jgi:hypothetical protein
VEHSGEQRRCDPSNRTHFEAALKQMADALVDAVEPTGIRAVEPVHPPREVRLGGLNDEVKMIRHQHPGGDGPPEPSDGDAEEVKKGLPIAIGAEDGTPFVAGEVTW